MYFTCVFGVQSQVCYGVFVIFFVIRCFAEYTIYVGIVRVRRVSGYELFAHLYGFVAVALLFVNLYGVVQGYLFVLSPFASLESLESRVVLVQTVVAVGCVVGFVVDIVFRVVDTHKVLLSRLVILFLQQAESVDEVVSLGFFLVEVVWVYLCQVHCRLLILFLVEIHLSEI